MFEDIKGEVSMDVVDSNSVHDEENDYDGSDDSSLKDEKVKAPSDFKYDPEHPEHGLAGMIVTSDIPFRVEEVRSLLDLFTSLNPEFKRVGMKAIKGAIFELYQKKKLKLKDALKKISGGLSLRFDIWRCEYEDPYFCLSVDYVDESWKICKKILQFYHFDEDEYPQAALACISDYEIESKISTITLSNDSSVEPMLISLKNHFRGKDKHILNGNLFHVRCFANLLHQMVQDLFSENYDTLVVIMDARYEGSSSKLEDKAFWSHKYFELEEALQTKEDILAQDFHFVKKPSDEEWTKVEQICTLLKNVHNLLEKFAEVKRPTANIYFHDLWEFRKYLNQESMSSDNFVSNSAKKMLEMFDKYWNEMFLVLAVATVMDPRYKMKYIEFSWKYCGSYLKGTLVRETVSQCYEEYVACAAMADKPSTESELEVPWLQDYQQFLHLLDRAPKTELDLYLDEPVIPWRKDFDVLNWWKNAISIYPTLSKMASDILLIPITTSDEAFYNDGTKLEPHISCHMDEDLKRALVCTGSWLRPPVKRNFFRHAWRPGWK